jgi:hypothetical protein
VPAVFTDSAFEVHVCPSGVLSCFALSSYAFVVQAFGVEQGEGAKMFIVYRTERNWNYESEVSYLRESSECGFAEADGRYSRGGDYGCGVSRMRAA